MVNSFLTRVTKHVRMSLPDDILVLILRMAVELRMRDAFEPLTAVQADIRLGESLRKVLPFHHRVAHFEGRVGRTHTTMRVDTLRCVANDASFSLRALSPTEVRDNIPYGTHYWINDENSYGTHRPVLTWGRRSMRSVSLCLSTSVGARLSVQTADVPTVWMLYQLEDICTCLFLVREDEEIVTNVDVVSGVRLDRWERI